MFTRVVQILAALGLILPAIATVPVQPVVQAVPQAAVGQNSASFLGVRPGDVFPTEYVEIPYSDPALETFSAITLEAWVKRVDATRSEAILCNDLQYSYCLSLSGSQLKLNLRSATTFFLSAGSVPAGIWTHVAATYDGSNVRLYINGLLDSSFAYSDGIGHLLSGTSLGIGADVPPNTDFFQNYFAGLIQNVRLWDYARSGAEIRASMFSVTDAAASGPKPVAEWRLAGDVMDYASTSGHDGIAHNIGYVDDGALPHDIRIPLVSATPILDGSCDTTKYAGAIQLTVSNTPVPTLASLMRTASDLWVCFDNLTAPSTGHDNWAEVYLDLEWSRHALSQAGDFSLEVHNDNTSLTRAGNSVGDYDVTSALDGLWNGIYTSHWNGFYNTYAAEFRISNSVFGGSSATMIGLALAQHWITGPGDDRMWPALSTYNSPATWSAAMLSGPGTARTFGGQILYATRIHNGPMPGIGGVPVNLVGYDSGGTSSVVASAVSNTNGFFNLASTDSYSQHRLEVDPMGVPKGLSADFPTAPLPGKASGPLTIEYAAAAAGSYGGNNFIFADQAPRPLDTTLSPHLLIITSQDIAARPDLSYYLDFKRLQGLTVEVASVEAINAAAGGGILTVQKIRNFEIDRQAVIGPAFKYVLLLGGNDIIPFGSLDGGASAANHCLTYGGWPTDWFYVDLTSNWDSNNNGCLADGIFGDKTLQQAHGYTPDASGNLFQNTVALGRIPIDDPNTAIHALLNSMQFEQQSGDFKTRALLASSMMDIKAGAHGCWLPPDDPGGGWFGPGDHTINGVKFSCASMNGTGTDGSYLSEAIRSKILASLGITPDLMYENGGAITGASPYKSPIALSENTVRDAIYYQSYGLVQFMGHGNGYGVYRMDWSSDANNDGLVNNPTEPLGNPAKSIYEISVDNLANSDTGLGARGGSAPIYMMASCSTGQFNQADSFAAGLLSGGQAVAWVGGVGVVPYSQNWTQPGQGNMQDITFYTTQLLLTGSYRLGDALWKVMSGYMTSMQASPGGWWALDFDLYGDPTLTYYGNPSGDANGAAWPMLRNDAAGLGYTSLTGPVQPKLLWSYPASPRGLEPLKPSQQTEQREVKP